MQTKIAIFCSGSGSNAQKIIEYFQNRNDIKIAVLMSNKADAYALEHAKNANIPTWVFNRNDFYNTELVLEKLKAYEIDYIILAGFLWLIPENLVRNFPEKIINIHPALLPKFGGKGMFGMHVHNAVVANKESESGITIHFVNAHYDEGNVIFQTSCALEPTDTSEEVAKKVLSLEHTHFPRVIEEVIQKKSQKK
ncbi:MAG TPA: phosphoribosylglycinamide formyltransferase [Cytophagaceae bacterium]|jgi:phosphoribosylglycinamide formyltransferase-1|nr:phosphoribosylglycinamide formyltransferase [Cytophagaceae bacterium]